MSAILPGLAWVLASAILPVPAAAAEKVVEVMSATWKGEPSGMFGDHQAREKSALNLPPACKGLNVYYTITGNDPEQQTLCRLSVAYGSGGSSLAESIPVHGTETKAGRIPSVLTEPRRRLVAECLSSDRFRVMNVNIRVSCEGGMDRNEEFNSDLEKFLRTE